MTRDVETPSFTFRLERVRDLRERAEEHAREELARELAMRMRGEALLREASHAVDSARDTGSGVFRRFGATGADMLAAQAYVERTERDRREAALDLDRQDAEVDARRQVLAAAEPDLEPYAASQRQEQGGRFERPAVLRQRDRKPRQQVLFEVALALAQFAPVPTTIEPALMLERVAHPRNFPSPQDA